VANLERIVRVGGLFCRADMVHVYFQPSFLIQRKNKKEKIEKFFLQGSKPGFFAPSQNSKI
jgi:hypothetical protein